MKRVFCMLLSVMLVVGVVCMAPPAQAAAKKMIAITYDDGPGKDTERLLDGLQERGIKATFFVVGWKIPANEKTVARMYREGHQVANHSYNHPHLTQLSDEEIRRQIQDTDALLDKICGSGTSYMVRPPYGDMTDGKAKVVDHPCVTWSYTPQDWIYTDAPAIKKNLLENVKDGDIILVHDTVPGTIEGTLEAIDVLKERGFEFVTVQEIFRRQGKVPVNGGRYRGMGAVGTYVDAGPVKAPVISYTEENGLLKVSVAGTAGVPIYYSTDGSDLNQESKQYTGPFYVTGPCTIKACTAYNMNGSRSDIVEEVITKTTASTPVLYVTGGLLTIDGLNEGANAYYSTTGAQATEGSQLYTGPVSIAPGTVISARAEGEGFFTSAEAKLVYSPLGNVFRDVFPEQWYFEFVDRAAAGGIMQGVGDNRFNPDKNVTRGQLVTFLYRASAAKAVDGDDSFSDVEEGEYYTEAVQWACKNGIASGYGDGTFRPNRNVSRQEMAAFFSRYLRYRGAPVEEGTPKAYTDANAIDSWAQQAVGEMTAIGLLQGDAKGTFRPHDGSIRAEAATVLIRAENYLTVSLIPPTDS